MYNSLLFEVQERIATITLNRPERYNAFNNELSFELIDALKKCDKDAAIRVVVITGAGDKAFCSGQDLKDVAGVERSLGDSVNRRYNPMTRAIINMEKPVIARVNGVAAGAGAGIVLAADVAIAADTASLLFAFVNIGLVLDSGSSFTLPRLTGRKKAFELATLGERISAQEALELGLVNRVVPAAELDAVTREWAVKYSEKAPKSLALIKRMLNRSHHSSLEHMLEMEMYCQEIAGNSGDYLEGVMAFTQKRKPNFTGK
jgi:2-(1,2-epoxy-1,2-dihydrophenyl)acetyl-CoA isomerase